MFKDFDLGSGNLYPVRCFRKDRSTVLEGTWFCLNFGNLKQSFLPEESANMDPRSAGQWLARAKLKDCDLALSRASLDGPDIWLEPLVRHAFFVSSPLRAALKKAKADKAFMFKKCRIA